MAQWSPAPQNLDRAFELERRALVLDPSLPFAHVLLGWIYLWKDRQYEQAIAEAEQAIALDSNNADSYMALAETLTLYPGRSKEAIGWMEKAMRLNPRYPALYLRILGTAYYWTGRTEEAIAAFERALARNPNWLAAHFFLAFVYSELGREAEAQAEVAEVLRLSPNFSLEGVRQRFPLKDPAALERMLAALRKAGLK
jgi:tetratricopeptide (TPR) repeat protein